MTLALEAARQLAFPVVIKPNIGGSGAGITSYASLDELAAADVTLGLDSTALVQEQLPADAARRRRVFDSGGPSPARAESRPGLWNRLTERKRESKRRA